MRVVATGALLLAFGAGPAGRPVLAGDEPVAPAPTQLRFDRRSPVVVAVERVKDAVVNISSTRLVRVRYGPFDDELFDRFFGGADPFGRTVQATSLGSGVIIHPAGYVLTNAHVVARASEVTCTLLGDEKLEATLISADPAHDLAVLKVKSAKPLPHIPMGRSDDLMIGETVIAIGNPLGYSHSVTTGVISAVDRQIKLGEELSLDKLIQTDASINPGNSGGPLLNINGDLIGINTAIRGDAQNIGFAIPIDAARSELAYLLDFARVNEVQFGATLGETGNGGPVVRQVQPGSPAAEAGLLAGDVIGAVDDKPCRSLIDFNVLMLDKPAGAACRLQAQRKDKSGQPATASLKLTLRAMPKPDGNELLWQRFGMKVRPMDAETARKLGLRTAFGLIVTQMAEDCQAAKIGLQVGDLLVQVDKLAVNSLDALGQALKKVQAGETVRMGFLRGRFQVWARLAAK